MDFYKHLIKPVLFQFDPDDVHEWIGSAGEIMGRSDISRQLLRSFYYYEHSSLETDVFGLHFKNPVGIAGGFAKDCRLIQTLPSVGFGFCEVGSITNKPYGGNKQPWNVRLKDDQSLIINYGLKNKGADNLKAKIKSQKRFIPLIINIAKTNDPDIKDKDSVEDYFQSAKKLQSLADIINLNISCPNSGDGTLLCENPKLLKMLLDRLNNLKITKPLVLKLKPDLDDSLLEEVIELCISYKYVQGFILSNLTKQRSKLTKITRNNYSDFSGGISGKPLQKLSDEMIEKVYRLTKGKYPIIGLGGIFTAEDAYRKICLGVSLVELATGMIYGGPATIKRINQGLVKLLEKDGFNSIAEAVGSKNK